MDMKEIRRELEERIRHAEKVLVGIGPEWKAETQEDKIRLEKAAAALNGLLAEKDCYILTTLQGEALAGLPVEKKHMTAPLDVSCTEKEWAAYMLWLSCTLNRETVLLELGEGFGCPDVIRWPFEKTALLNQKAFLYRIHKKFYQIPDELSGKAASVACHSLEFFTQEEEHGGY